MRKTTVGLATGGLLVALSATGASSAAPTRQAEEAGGTRQAEGTAAATTFNLIRRFGREGEPKCEIGRLGEDPCGKRSYGVLKGKTVRIALEASGGKEVFFKIYRARDNKELGNVDMNAGDREEIWENGEGRKVNVYFTADASGQVKTNAIGKFLFGPYVR